MFGASTSQLRLQFKIIVCLFPSRRRCFQAGHSLCQPDLHVFMSLGTQFVHSRQVEQQRMR
jgi:hypothetical protein